jgi:hypothetical protein
MAASLRTGGFRTNTADDTHAGTGHVLEILLPGEGTGTHSRQLHLLQSGNHGLDLAVAAEANPTFYIHSVTTPITDYLRVGAHDGTTAVVDVVGGTTLATQIDGTTAMSVTASALVFDQAANDTAIFSLRSSDVATGLTTIPLGPDVTTSDYLVVGKVSATLGGAYVTGLSESGSTGEGIVFEAWSGTPQTVDTSTSLGVICMWGGQHLDGTADVDMAVNSNLIVIGEIDASAVTQTRLLLKADDGELHLGNIATQIALDMEDDIMLIRTLQLEGGNEGIVESPYEPNPFYDHGKLMDLGLAGEKNDEGFYLFPLQPTLRLHEGAMWQLFNDMMGIAEALPADVRKKLPERVQSRLALLDA